MNQNAIIGLAIATAAYNRDWCRDTSFDEMFDDFEEIAKAAQINLEWTGIKDHEITTADVAESLYGLDPDEYEERLKDWA